MQVPAASSQVQSATKECHNALRIWFLQIINLCRLMEQFISTLRCLLQWRLHTLTAHFNISILHNARTFQFWILWHIHLIHLKCLLTTKGIQEQVIAQTNVFIIPSLRAKIRSMESILYFTSMMEPIRVQLTS